MDALMIERDWQLDFRAVTWGAPGAGERPASLTVHTKCHG
jgi:hypothetical protein